MSASAPPVPAPPAEYAKGTQTDNDEQHRRELLARTNAAGVTALGQVAAIATHEDSSSETTRQEDEPADADLYSWADAAHWRPEGGEDDAEELLAREPDTQFGSDQDMGWAGLLRHQDRPGGVILSRNPYGRHSIWTADSEEDLAARWHQLNQEHDAYRDAAQSREAMLNDTPKIWVGSLADYTAGHLHGTWLDATGEADDLANAVQFILRNSHEPGAEEYGIFDYDNFGHGTASLLGEYPSFKTISKIAQGIAEHGEAFAAWAAYVGPEQTDQLDRFNDHYLGEYDSLEDYAEQLLQECEGYRVIDDAPEWLRPYLKMDLEGYARDLGYDLHVVDKADGGVIVFDTRC